MKIKLIPITLFLSLVCQITQAEKSNSDFYTIADLHQVNSLMIETALPEQSLVVVDIDDTLLEAADFVGSDKWYRWQRGTDMQTRDGKPLIIKEDEKFHCLFSTLGVLFDLGQGHATQTDAPAWLEALLQKGINVLLLTSRSPDYRGATERELKNAGFNWQQGHLLANTQALAFSLNDGRRNANVSYQNGIVMSSGLNKGMVLKDLLKRLNRNYSNIYFVDDGLKNINNMLAAYKNDTSKSDSSRMHAFHYTKVSKAISFQEVAQSNRSKAQLEGFMRAAFPKKASAFAAGDCN